MSFAKKFTALIVIFSVPLIFLLGLLIQDLNENKKITKSELQGIENLKILSKLLYEIYDFRDYSVLQEVNFDPLLLDLITERKNRINENLKELKNELAVNFYNKKIEKQYTKLISIWETQNLSMANVRGGAELQLQHYEKAVIEMELLIRVITYESSLVHDETPRNFYLVNLFLNDISAVMKEITKIRTLGAYALSMPSMDSYTIDVLNKNYESTEKILSLITYSSLHIDDYLENESELKETMADIVKHSLGLLDYFNEHLLVGEKSKIDWKNYFDESTRSVEEIRKINDKLLPDIESNLLLRAHNQKVRLVILIVVTVFLYLLVSYFVVGVYYQLRQTLSSFNKNAMKLAEGDFGLRVNIEGKDELSELGITFNNMAALLQRNQEELQANQDRLSHAQKMESMGRMISGIAHEVNTPLGIAITSFSLSKSSLADLEIKVLDGKLSKQALTDYIEVSKESGSLIERNLNRVASLIETFKQINSTQNVSPQKSVDLQNLLMFAYSPYEESHADIMFECSEFTCEIDTDVNLLTLAISSIIENAIEHGLQSKEDKLISLKVTDNNDTVDISIRDNGRGLTQVEKEQIFEPFFTTGRIKGKVGLGMNIVYLIVTQSFAGKISVSSKPSEYTEILINLPKYRQDCEELETDIDIENYL